MTASTRGKLPASRARWLSDLAKAIDEAQWLAWRIGVVEARNPAALELYVRLEVVRAEVEALNGWSSARAVQDHGPSCVFPGDLCEAAE